MFRTRFVCLLLALCCLLGLGGAALALEVDCDAAYCFSAEDFSQEEPLAGICILELPDPDTGTVLLGSRVLRSGDILTADQLAQMTFAPLRTEADAEASVTYLPIYDSRVEKEATMTISIRGKEDKAPVAEDSVLETYKNLPNEAQLKATDPEGQALTYTITRQPKRGEVVIRADGSFLYTPKKNKVGVDSFTYTATDPAGNVSREATVTIQILKPTESQQYTDTAGTDCRFAAEWMKNTGLFVGEQVGGESCFDPDALVTKGQFLAMVIRILDIPAEDTAASTIYSDEAPDWLKPYMTAALRSGLLTGIPATQTGAFGYDDPITGAEAAVMLQNAMALNVPAQDDAEALASQDEAEVPAWAASALSAMEHSGISLSAEEALNRGQVANVLYRVSLLAPTAPGTAVFQIQQ